ncbi:unnamed protein product, partial [marine sediment metagenome]
CQEKLKHMAKHTIQKDKCLTRIDDLITMVKAESCNQINKWGIQTHSIFEWLTYTTEELGELANAISEFHYRNGKKENIVNEAIQTATLSLKIAEMYL